MKIEVYKIFKEAEINFEISYKISKFIREKLLKVINEVYKIEESKVLSLWITTRKHQNKLEVELKITKKSFDYFIKLPYEEISKHEDQRESFLKYYFDGLVMVFRDFGVHDEHIREVEELVKKEVLDNDEYKYIDKRIKVDLSKIGL